MEIKNNNQLSFTSEKEDLQECNFIIVTVPTPVTADKQPDLSPLISASKMIGEILKKGTTIIYESTVYPGATEEICVPVLEKVSKLNFNKESLKKNMKCKFKSNVIDKKVCDKDKKK